MSGSPSHCSHTTRPDWASTTYTVQLSGPSDKLDAFIRAIGKTTILEVVRSGVSGISRGEKVLSA